METDEFFTIKEKDLLLSLIHISWPNLSMNAKWY